MHFASTIHNVAFTVVLGYAELCSGTGDGSFQKKQFSDLCKVFSLPSFHCRINIFLMYLFVFNNTLGFMFTV